MIIFARTRYHYDSYSDFWKLVELSNFDTCYIDEIDLSSDNTYIFSPTNGEFRPHITNEKGKKSWSAKVIWWNLERPSSDTNAVIDDITEYINEAWVSDKYYASLNSGFKFVGVGSHPDLRLHKENLDKVYDYCHMSYVYGRRDYIHNTLAQRGLKIGPNGWGEERDKTLRSSNMLVNVHQDPFPIAEPLRFAVNAAYSLPIISETIIDPYPLVPGVDIILAHYDDLINQTLAVYNTDLTQMGNALYDNLCIRNTFRASVEKGLGL